MLIMRLSTMLFGAVAAMRTDLAAPEHEVKLDRRLLPLWNLCMGSAWIGRFCRSPVSNHNSQWLDLCWHMPLYARWSVEPTHFQKWPEVLLTNMLDLGKDIDKVWFIWDLINHARLPHHDAITHKEAAACPYGYSCRPMLDEDFDAHISCIRLAKDQFAAWVIPGIVNNEGETGYVHTTKKSLQERFVIYDTKNVPRFQIGRTREGSGDEPVTSIHAKWTVDADIADASFSAMLLDEHDRLVTATSGISARLLADGSVDSPPPPPPTTGKGNDIDATGLLCASSSVLRSDDEEFDQICEPLRTVDVHRGDTISMYYNLATATAPSDMTLYFGLQHYPMGKVIP